MLRPVRLLVPVLGALPPFVRAQVPTTSHAKPTLASADSAKWETLSRSTLSPDGKWVAYDFRRGGGSTELRYRVLDADNERTARSASNPQFSSNSRWLLYTIGPDSGGGGRGGRGGRGGGGAGAAGGGGGTNRNKAAIVDLRSGSTAVFDDITSFALSNDGSHVALRRYPAQGRRTSDIIVRDLDSGAELTFGNVAESAWSDDGSMLAMAIDVDGRTGNGIQLLNTRSGVV